LGGGDNMIAVCGLRFADLGGRPNNAPIRKPQFTIRNGQGGEGR